MRAAEQDGRLIVVEPRHEFARLVTGVVSTDLADEPLPVDVTALTVKVDGFGDVGFPITAPRAKRLCRLGSPAPFGKGEDTLIDPGVRDTWQLPINRVHVDWGAEREVVDAVRAALSLPPSAQLRLDLHSMLVYERGQFFAPHQDSEKADGMIGSLVVLLPSAFSGGELVVHHGQTQVTFTGSRTSPTAVAFYADRVHEVKPVRTGHRITLTFNVFLDDGEDRVDLGEPPADLATEAATLLDRHFATAVKRSTRQVGDDRPPIRLAYLLDHQYTERSLSWGRLKGVDAERAALLRQAADVAHCEATLGLVEIQETYEAEVEWAPRRGSWGYDQEDDEDADDEEAGIGYLIDSDVTLTHWRCGAPETLQVANLYLRDDELCTSTPTQELPALESEYTGFMGNYGNTVDRWYRRAVVLVWPVGQRFANRAELSQAWALDDLLERLAGGDASSVSHDVTTLEPVWEPSAELLAQALRAAALIDDPAAARMLLAPFAITALGRREAPDLIAATQQHGEHWAVELIDQWFAGRHRPRALDQDAWFITLPAIVEHLQSSQAVSRALLSRCWRDLQGRLEAQLPGYPQPSIVRAVEGFANPLGALLRAVAIADVHDVREDALALLTSRSEFVTAVLPLLDQAETWERSQRERAGLDRLTGHAITVLRQRLSQPSRAVGDWAMAAPTGCQCEDCGRLAAFLTDRDQAVLEWPLAKPRRQHIHVVIDRAELPVTHRTRRTGRPFTLVLTKTADLFARDWRTREADESQLAALLAKR